VARDAFSLGHFPLLCGIIGFAVAIEEMVHHPTTEPSGEIVAALGVGIALFIGSTVWVFWRTCHRLLVSRLVLLVLAEGVLVLVAAQDPTWLLSVFVVGLGAMVVVEAVMPPADTADELEIPATDT
jgi:low temperature requirement protein LtrA